MMITKARSRDWRCRFLRMHRWVSRTNEDGERYRACADCGRLQYNGTTPSIPSSRIYSGPI